MPQTNVVKQFQPDAIYHVYNHAVAELSNLLVGDKALLMIQLFERYLSHKPTKNRSGSYYPNYSDRLELMAFCLMPNHFHLLLYQKDSSAITEFMRSLATSFSMVYNKTMDRRGTVFETAFKAVEVTNDPYFHYISKYIHLNPVDLGVDPEDYTYSSYKSYINGDGPKWLNQSKILSLFSGREAYLEFLRQK